MRSPRRMMCAAVLGFECIVLGLVTPVLITVEELSRVTALGIGLGLAFAAVLIAGLLRAEWAYFAGFALQAAALALGFVVPAMFVLGLIFGALWTTAYVLGRKIESQQAGASGG
ncbi:MAG: DUF4233 domain-containing protein [Propionibacteriales bacterium]|nr:DUF4233 domain-containing protein [Propionibacteriales bacterium]